MNHQQEIHQFNESHFRESDVSQHIVMMGVGDNVMCVGLYGAVNKLVVVWVGCDKVEVVMGCKELGVSVKYYAHNELNDKFFLCLLLAEPLMKVHFVNLVKAFLVQLTRLPHFFCQFVKLLGIVIAHELLDVIQLFIALDARKHIKKVELCGIENSWLYTFHNFYAINSRCKDKHIF